MSVLRYSRSELLASHPWVALHAEHGYTLHGGFDENGTYVSPRTLYRWPAIRAWREALLARSLPLVDVSTAILKAEIYPTLAQQRLLLRHGFSKVLWDAMTKTGVIESRAAQVRTMRAPDLQTVVVEDISGCVAGHLQQGLMEAHGLDEAGDPDQPGVGGHDLMWFAARDIAFGPNAHQPQEIGTVFKPAFRREMPFVPMEYEQFIKFLMNVLMLEVRGEAFFGYCIAILRDADLFPQRSREAASAARIVERIQADEASHIAYLQVLLSELRSFHFRGENGERALGSTFIDPVWERMVQWHSDYERKFADQRRQEVEDQLRLGIGPERSAKLIAEFHMLESAQGESTGEFLVTSRA